ncbi:unnamed protein product [Heligmosomoides polygyrus]|uniref:Recep_L_domain domain-containing protein n=1 Tax=Heligmosomoides polygyrus TaxID=6339 RepID=A0A183FU08_HELPZ|nr:unnamed protein product [Heligmosomoides polygyrus]
MILSTFLVLMQIEKSILQVPLDLDCGITSKIVLNTVTIVPLLNSSCVLIASSLRLDETTDVPFAQLHRTLNRMEMINGLEVENTALRNLSFLSDYVVIAVSKADGCELDGPLTETDTHKLDDNCSAIYGNFELAEKGPPTYDTLMMKFGHATKFIGEVLIMKSEYQDLEFFGNLRTISVVYDIYGKFKEKFLRVQSNLKLQRLALNMLQVQFIFGF